MGTNFDIYVFIVFFLNKEIRVRDICFETFVSLQRCATSHSPKSARDKYTLQCNLTYGLIACYCRMIVVFHAACTM